MTSSLKFFITLTGLFALILLTWVALSSPESATEDFAEAPTGNSSAIENFGGASTDHLSPKRSELDSIASPAADRSDAPTPSDPVPFGENEELLAKFRAEFPSFAANYDPGWDDFSEIVDGHLEDTLLMSGILLEDRRLQLSDFESLSAQEKTGTISLLATVAGRRMSLGIDPFGQRDQKEKEALRTQVLADGLGYSPQTMIDALSYSSGRVFLDEDGINEFANLRIGFLKEASHLEAQINDRSTAAMEFLVLHDSGSLMAHGFHAQTLMPDLDAEWVRLNAMKAELAIRYREATQNFLLEYHSN